MKMSFFLRFILVISLIVSISAGTDNSGNKNLKRKTVLNPAKLQNCHIVCKNAYTICLANKTIKTITCNKKKVSVIQIVKKKKIRAKSSRHLESQESEKQNKNQSLQTLRAPMKTSLFP